MMCHSIIICKPITTSNILIEIELMMQILPLYLPDAEFEQLKLNPSKSDRKYIRYQEFLREHAQATEQEIAAFEQEYQIELLNSDFKMRKFLKIGERVFQIIGIKDFREVFPIIKKVKVWG